MNGAAVDAWRGELRVTKAGAVKPTLGNAVIFLQNDERFGGELRFNEMSGEPELRGARVNDPVVTEIRVQLEKSDRVTFAEHDLNRAIDLVSRRAPYHPVREYLTRLRWDGRMRFEWLVRDVLHAEPTPLHVAYVTKFMLSAVARAMKPGSKVDTVLILVGDQGARKSTFFSTLGGEWFTDTDMDLGSKDAYLLLGASWIVEWGELNTLTKSSKERVKGFLSANEDVFRRPYSRGVERLPRTAVVVGSTNERVILHDETGSRRFWVLPVGSTVDVDALRPLRDQIWAEARARFESGEKWWLERDEDRQRAEAAQAYEAEDPWTPTVLAWIGQRSSAVTMSQILDGALELSSAQITRREENRVGGILRRAGYESERRRILGHPQRVWFRPDQLRVAG
jgi:putative DNA primase/helicase